MKIYLRQSMQLLPMWTITAALLLAGTGATIAADLPASDSVDLFDMTMRAAVQKYPELIQDPTPQGFYTVSIVVRADGTIYQSEIQVAPPPDPSSRFTFDALTESNGITKIAKGQQIADLGPAANNILVVWYVLPADFDEMRTARRVADVVRAQHDELMLPTAENMYPSKKYQHVYLLTVLMSEDGSLERKSVKLISIRDYRAMNPGPVGDKLIPANPYNSFNPPPVPAEAFQVLGVEADQIGLTGLIAVQPEPAQIDADADLTTGELRKMREQSRDFMLQRTVIVRYAWPRRPGDPVGR